ncbi:DUF2000 domain-containing protein [Photobacterium sp. CCB-ST2H9]|uniref:DUF2000 domain-containing protein n=1 Tax=unclassified Photobacterium TaxID=2628852 RepID=UPI002005CB67|nr:DUF2000 domain-containing protein [Photobacterium sp. CCB-ST2H9]UTM59521.1 DUF2000 domain-containing protein [Photobacterium sp. CCB-ST2H9]
MMSSSLPDENQKRFVVVLNKKLELGRTLNVLGHISVGLSAQLEQGMAHYVDYTDKDGQVHPSLSHYPFIVLKADNSNKIRNVREAALAKGVTFTDFTHTMTDGGSLHQQAVTAETAEADLEYMGIGLFGDAEMLKEMTRKFSLYR